MDTSRTRMIKSLLIEAWRERWTDIVWGIRIKSVLPRGVSGDVYDLADCILQQALVGPSPNKLFMSYLMHSLSSRDVSYGAVLSSIGRYQCLYKPCCILSLLDLLKTFLPRVGCHGNEEECIALCKAVVSVTYWLYLCVCHSLTKCGELKQQSAEYVSIMEHSYEALFYFKNSTFIKALLFVGKFEDSSMYAQVILKHKELEEKVSQYPSVANVSKEIVEGALSLVSSVDNLHMVPTEQTLKNNLKIQRVGTTINIMIAIDAVLSPANDITTFVKQLLVIKKMEHFTLPQLYCEIIRSCLLGIVNVYGEGDLKWYAFTFLKLPHLVLLLHNTQKDNEENAFEKGLDILLHYTPLLDQMDLRSNCDSLEYLTNEFIKVGMLTEVQGRKLLARRQAETCKVPNPKPGASKPSSERGHASVTLILRAEQTLKSILVSFDSDYLKNQDPLLRFLCQILPTKNFKLILAAFSATGKINVFITKLIEYNDYNKFVSGETVKASQTRALMFDVTFLLLFYVTQYYGIEVVKGNAEKKDCFFVQWITECLAEGGRFKCPDLALRRADKEATDALLEQFLNTEQEVKTHEVEWHKICWTAPAAAKELLIAWEHGAISTEKVKSVLDHIKGDFCFIPMVISAWLCNHINILHHEEQLKPMNMLQQFMAPQSESASPLTPSGRQTPEMPIDEQEKPFYLSRSALMVSIINKMMLDLHPPKQTNYKIPPLIPHALTVSTPLGKILDEVYEDVHQRGWLDLKSIQYFETLFIVGGARFLCDCLVRKLLGYRSTNDINRAVDMIVGIFYLDVEQCALALLLHVLPFYLQSETHQDRLAEPHGTAIARLSVIATFAALESRQCSSASRKAGSKRRHAEVGVDDSNDYSDHSRPSKIHRSNAELLEDTPFEIQSLSEEHLLNAMANPINKAIADLMRTLMIIASDSTMSARSFFPVYFIEQVVLRAKDQSSTILQFMPLGLVGLLLKKYPEKFSHELILAVSSMQSPRARKVSALSLCQLTIAQNRLADYMKIGF